MIENPGPVPLEIADPGACGVSDVIREPVAWVWIQTASLMLTAAVSSQSSHSCRTDPLGSRHLRPSKQLAVEPQGGLVEEGSFFLSPLTKKTIQQINMIWTVHSYFSQSEKIQVVMSYQNESKVRTRVLWCTFFLVQVLLGNSRADMSQHTNSNDFILGYIQN